MATNGGSNQSSGSWWSRHKDAAFSSIFFAVVGYLAGSYMETHIELKNTIETIQTTLDKHDKTLSDHIDETKVAIDHIVYSTIDGVDCKVGINSSLPDHVVSMSADRAKGFRPGENIYLINNTAGGACKNIVTVIVAVGNVKASGDRTFYVNEKMLKRLGIEDKYPERIGVFDMTYKRERDESNDKQQPQL